MAFFSRNSAPDEYTQNQHDVIKAEREHIAPERLSDAQGEDDYKALAFSGGGIRSASFALGVMQALVDKDQLKKFDYLSTVSGGGYIGACLTWYLSHKIPGWMRSSEQKQLMDADEYFGTSKSNFPLGQKYQGNRLASSDYKPNAILDFIRQHGNYLTPGQGLGGMALAGYVLRAVVVSVTIYLCLLSALMVVFQTLEFFQPVPGINVEWLRKTVAANWFFFGASLLILIFLVLSFAYSLYTRVGIGKAVRKYQLRTFVQKRSGELIALSLLLLVVGSLRISHHLIEQFWEGSRAAVSSGSLLTGVAAVLSQFRSITRGGSKLSNAIIMLAGVFLIYGLFLSAYWFAELILTSHHPTLWLTCIVLLIAIVVSTCVNVNYLGIHRMYRDRLMETFLPNLDAVKNNSWDLASEADTAVIDAMCQSPNRRPYHLINTNLVLVDSHQSKYRGRGGDNFLVSPLFCGSDATGWRKSSSYMRDGSRQGMTLATAMAISGAAVNPNTGPDGKGLTRGRLVSTVLSILNLRLGFWAPHPNPKKLFKPSPNFIYPALTGGVLGGGLRETRRAIELSDGGHFENLAVYELIRRRVKFILAVDGGADPNFDFGDLANLVEKVRVDFGATIDFDGEEYCLANLLPGSEPEDYFVRKYNGAKNCFAVATIDYADGSCGTLIYMKTTLIKELPADLLGYKTANPLFPDEPTSDQFFDETQFEAYRELGYRLGHVFLKANELKCWL